MAIYVIPKFLADAWFNTETWKQTTPPPPPRQKMTCSRCEGEALGQSLHLWESQQKATVTSLRQEMPEHFLKV